MTLFDHHAQPRPVLPLNFPPEVATAVAVPKPPQAGLGITSFVVALISGLGAIILAIVAALLIKTPGAGDGPESPVNYLLGTWLYATAVLSLIGIVFGIGGVLQRGRRIGLAITGLALNIMMPLGVFALLIIGMTAHTVDRLSRSEIMQPDRPTRAIAVAAHADEDAMSEPASMGWATVVGASVTLAAFLALRMCFRSSDVAPSNTSNLRRVMPPPLPKP